jgi:DNA-binding protein H-NS
MKEYGGQQGRERSCSVDSDESGFMTPPPPWHEFTTPITNTGRRRGAQYVAGRLQVGEITPTIIRVQEKVEKAADKMILAGQLSTELLTVNNAKQKEREERNNAPNKVVQKYGEIYGNVAQRQIAADELAEDIVVNMHERRMRKPHLEYYKWFVQEFPDIFYILRDDGRFKSTRTLKELLLI